MSEKDSKAYWDGFRDGVDDAKKRPGSYVVVFEDSTTPEDVKQTAGLLHSIRGVVAVLPVGETHSGHLAWRELVEVLGCDPCDDHAQSAALANARSAASSLAGAGKAWDIFFKMATPEQQQAILVEVYPHLGKPG